MTGHTHKRLFAIGITIALLAGTSWGEERTWTDVTGKFSVTAELVEVRGDKVVLRRQNGKQITVPLAKLNAEDQQFLKLAELKAQAQAELEKGELFFEKQDWDTAIVCFTEAIRLNPNYAAAYYDRPSFRASITAELHGPFAKSRQAAEIEIERAEARRTIFSTTAAVHNQP